jgi:anti-sigma regulatory factor (Ser/Thr protein kinase)
MTRLVFEKVALVLVQLALISRFVCGLLFAGAVSAQTVNNTPVKVHVTWHHQFEFAGIYAAIQQGFYKERGLDVEVLDWQKGQAAVEVVRSGQADFSVGYSPILVEQAKRGDLSLVMAGFQFSPMILLSKYEIQNLTDLSGKTVMTSPQTEIANLLDRADRVNAEPVNRVAAVDQLSEFIESDVHIIEAYMTNWGSRVKKMGLNYQTRGAMLLEAELVKRYIKPNKQQPIGELNESKLDAVLMDMYFSGSLTKNELHSLDVQRFVFSPEPVMFTAKEKEALFSWLGLAVIFIAMLVVILWGRHRQQQLKASFEQRLSSERAGLIAMLLHELRSPMTVARFALDVDDPAIRDNAHGALDEIEDVLKQVEYAEKTIEKGVEARWQSVDLRRLLERFQQRSLTPERLRLNGLESLQPIELDADFMVIILNNLLRNALKYSPKDSVVEVEASNSGEYLLKITNNLGELKAPDVEKVFLKYHREADVEQRPGSGLGLYISKHLAEKMNLTLECQVNGQNISFIVAQNSN